MLENISVRESHAIAIRNLGRLTFSRKTSANVLKLDASKQGIQPGKRNTSAVILKRHASKQGLHGGNLGKLSTPKYTGNMHKLFDCIRTPLKRF